MKSVHQAPACPSCRWFAAAGLLAGLLAMEGCAGRASVGPAPLAAVQRAGLQTKEIPGDFDTVFSATISVLQDQGWQIQQAGKQTGVVQARSVRREDILGPKDDWRAFSDRRIARFRDRARDYERKKMTLPKWTRWEELTAHLERWGQNVVRERISIVRAGSLPSGTYWYPEPKAFGKKKKKILEPGGEESVVEEDAQVYQRLFQDIQKAAFLRQGQSGQ